MINVKDIKQSEEFFYYIEDKCRFVIGQKKGTSLICIGLNPSTATPSAPDPTYCKLMKIATNEKITLIAPLFSIFILILQRSLKIYQNRKMRRLFKKILMLSKQFLMNLKNVKNQLQYVLVGVPALKKERI